MPAHLSRQGAAAAIKSNGRAVSDVDWRANRLVDAVAKAAAGDDEATARAVKCLRAAGLAYRHEAAVLGASTRAANLCRVAVTTASVNSTFVTRRDSVSAKAQPRPRRRPAAKSLPPAATATAATVAAAPRDSEPRIRAARRPMQAGAIFDAGRAVACRLRAERREGVRRRMIDEAVTHRIIHERAEARLADERSRSPRARRAIVARLLAAVAEPLAAAPPPAAPLVVEPPPTMEFAAAAAASEATTRLELLARLRAPPLHHVREPAVRAPSCTRTPGGVGRRPAPSLAALVQAHTRAYHGSRRACTVPPSARG